VAEELRSVAGVSKKFWECKEGCWFWLVDKHPERIAEDVFKPGRPMTMPPEFVEDAHDVRDDKAAFLYSRRRAAFTSGCEAASVM
jgi:hypothetical protein